jgi:heme exporter protein D
MSYQGYVVAAYAVFAAFLAWDFLAPRLRLARAHRAIRLQAQRVAARAPVARP